MFSFCWDVCNGRWNLYFLLLISFFLEQKLADLSTVPTARLIDGILLTKFDTIDDKVGTCAEYMLDQLL
jgi:hypothetical protein